MKAEYTGPSPLLLIRLREELGLTRRQLAEQLGISYRTVEGWEQGRREAPPFVELALYELARRLERPLRKAGRRRAG